jgi:hypothetical protein
MTVSDDVSVDQVNHVLSDVFSMIRNSLNVS